MPRIAILSELIVVADDVGVAKYWFLDRSWSWVLSEAFVVFRNAGDIELHARRGVQLLELLTDIGGDVGGRSIRMDYDSAKSVGRGVQGHLHLM